MNQLIHTMAKDTAQAGQQKDQAQKSSALKDAIKKHGNTEIKPDTQMMLNKPVAEKMGEVDKAFLNDVMSKAESGEINLYTPQSLINADIYENLKPEQEQKVDITLQNLLFELRQIKSLYDAGERENMQMANMIQDVRIKKENLEKEVGDVLKI